MTCAFKKGHAPRLLRTVPDGNEAIGYLSGKGKFVDRTEYPIPHLLLLDIKMPRKNGFEVLQWIRQESSLALLPVIMLSASLEQKDQERAYELGANSFLMKPTNIEKLGLMVEALENYWLRFNQPFHLSAARA